MIDLAKFITEKLKVTTSRSQGDISIVRLLYFLLWFYDVDSKYELSMEFIKSNQIF